MASRILGMGDMLTLIESATQNIDEDEAMGMMEKLMSGNYNYNDLLKQFKMIKKDGIHLKDSWVHAWCLKIQRCSQ